MIRRNFPLLFSLAICAFLLSQLSNVATTKAEETMPAPFSSPVVEKRMIAPGERTVMSVTTTGLVEVVIFEELDTAELAAFQAGQTPRTAKVFSGVKALSYPLSSVTGATFHIRVSPQMPGEITIQYAPGTSEEAMGQLRKGQNLVRNQGTLRADGLAFMPIYQLVPGTIIRLEITQGQGTLALLKTLDYLKVKGGEAKLADFCATQVCVQSGGKAALEVKVDEFEDLYLIVEPESGSLEFTYAVIATPDVLNYISSCG